MTAPRKDTFREVLLDAKKALGVLGTLEATAVGLGFGDNAVAGYVTAGIGAVGAAVAYLLDNEPKPSRRAQP